MCNHVWKLEKNGDIDIHAYDNGVDYGPKCIVCGDYFNVNWDCCLQNLDALCLIAQRLTKIDVADFVGDNIDYDAAVTLSYGIRFFDDEDRFTLGIKFNSLESATERAKTFQRKYPNFEWFVIEYTTKLISV